MSSVKIVCDNVEEFEALKQKSTKLRVILLERQNKNMFCKLSTMNLRDKRKFIDELNNMWNTMSDEEIDAEFNDICVNKLFDPASTDVENLPSQYISAPDHSVLYNSPASSLEGEEETKC